MGEQQQGVQQQGPQPIRCPEFHAKACLSGGYVVTVFHPDNGMQEHAVETSTGVLNLAKEF